MLFRNSIKRILKALVIAFVMLVSPAFATTYNITYELDGGTLASGVSNPATYDDDTLKVLDLPIKSGYVFKGWYENSNFTGDPVKWISANSTSGNKTYYAKWDTFASLFQITTTDDIVSDGTGANDYFAFSMSAAGVFYIDWGDNSGIEVIDRRGNTTEQLYSHTYDNTTARSYNIRFGGQATGYSTNSIVAAISFGWALDSFNSANENRNDITRSKFKIAGISGTLGALFPTIGATAQYDPTTGLNPNCSGGYNNGDCYTLNAIQPSFANTFFDCQLLKGSIPSELFSGIKGQPVEFMFTGTFDGCQRLTGSIPSELFSGLQGQPATSMFSATFGGCQGLTGSIPSELFSGIQGELASYSFVETFRGCSRLTGSVPATLFAGIDIDSVSSNDMSSVFGNDSALSTSCQFATHQAITGFESYFDGKVACVDADKVYCKKGERFDTNTNACVICQSGDTCPEFGAIYSCPNGMGGNSDSTACIASNTITYNLNGGTNNPDNPSTYTGTITLKEPSKANSKFMGWYKNSDFTGTEVKTLVQGTDGTVTLYAKWGTFENKFQITTTNDIVSDGTGNNDYFLFRMSAAGVFWIDWGDGTIERIDRTNNTTSQYYSHTYTNVIARSYDIKFDGLATGYSTDSSGAVITFASYEYFSPSVNENRIVSGVISNKLRGISGSLGALFPTIGASAQYDPTASLAYDSDALKAIQPRFGGTFANCTNLIGSIPGELFSGIRGKPVQNMFSDMFSYCYNLGHNVDGYYSPAVYYIPATLLAGLDTNTPITDQINFGSFAYTGLRTSCPDGTHKAITGFESYFGGKVACVADDEIYCKQGLKYDSTTKGCAVCTAGDTCDTGFVQQCPTDYVSNAVAANGYDSNSTATQCLQEYSITYNNMADATNSSDNPSSYTVETTLPIYLEEPTKSGFAFLGWYDNNQFTGSAITQISAGSTGDITLYAKWAPIYSITYDSMNADAEASTNPIQYYVGGSTLYYKNNANDVSWSSVDYIKSLYSPTRDNFGFVGWCVFDSTSEAAAANYDCTYPTKYLTARSDYSAYDYNYGGYLNVSNKTNLYLYAKWAPIYSISYDTTGAYSVPNNPGNYWYDGNYYHYTNENSYEVSNGVISLASPSGNQEFQGWYVCTSQQNNVAAAAESNDCIGLVYSIPNPDGNQLSLPSNLWLYAKFAPATVDCLAGTYAVNNGNGLTCTTCQANNYCLGGYGLTAEAGNNGLYSCSSANPNKAYSDPGAQSPSDCYFRCPSYHGYSSDSTSPYYVPIKTEEPYNFFYSSNTDPVWKDFNGDGIESNSECIKPAYSINLETLKCSTPAAELQEQFGDYYYALGLDQPCNPNNMEAGLMSCNYDVSTGNYTGCSSMVTVCDASDLQTMAGLFMGNSASTDDFLDIELGRKGLSQSTVNWNTFFIKQDNSYINDISTLDSSADITKSAVGCDTQTCSAGEYARIEYDSNGIITSSSCETCPAGSFCPGNTYSFANGDFSVDPTNSNVYTAGKFACPAGSTSEAESETCTCVGGTGTASDAAYMPAGNILGDSDINGATKTPELVTFLDSNDNTYQACANGYVSALDSTALANSQLADPTATLSEAGLRAVVCKYNTASGKYDLCSPAFTVCDAMYVGMLQLYNTPSQLASALAPAFSKGQSSYITDSMLSRVFNIDTIESVNTCSCDTGFEWSKSGNTCCPDGYACCLAGSQYDFKAERCVECSGSDCPTTYTKRVVCPEGSYIDQSAIGTNAQCVTCPLGHYCPGVSVAWDGQSTLTDAAAGKFACADGSYADETGLTSCKVCANGMSTGNATGSTSASACSVTTCVDDLTANHQYDPAGTTYVDRKPSALITFYDTKNNSTYQKCTKAYVSVLDNTVFTNGIANATADELSKSGMRLIMCTYNNTTGKYTDCSYAVPACDATYRGMMLGYTTDQIATAVATVYGAPYLPSDIMVDDDASGALGIDGVRNFYGSASSGTPTCAASCPVGYEWESYYDDKNAETVYTGNTCCPDGYACCLAGWKYDFKEERCVECSGDNCPTTYTKSFVCPAGEYINQIGQNEYQCVTCDAGSYCPGIIWDVTTTFDSGKYTCAQNTFSGSGATECSACPTGSTSSAGSTSLSACTCHNESTYDPAGTTFVSGAGKQSALVTFYDIKKNETYQSCTKAYVSVLDNTVFANGIANATADELSKSGMRLIMCEYDGKTGKYTSCSNAIPACDTSYSYMMLNYTTEQIATAIATQYGAPALPNVIMGNADASGALGIDGVRNFYGDASDGIPTCAASCPVGYEWESYYDDKNAETVYTGNTCCPDGYACCLAGWKYDSNEERCVECSGSDCPTTYTKVIKPVSCPATNSYYTSPAPINTQGGSGVMELDMPNMELGVESSYGTTQNECVAIRLYYENSTPFMTSGGMDKMTASDYVTAGASVAFCKYNPSTGHYDGDCTPKYSLCSTDNVMNLFASGDSVGVMKAVLGITNDATIDKYFTVSASDLSKESKQNRCGVVVCPDASDFSNMSLSGAGMMQMGDGMEGSYGSTPNECVSMRVYYDDGSVLFDGKGPSMDIDDWVDAGASIAFCKYNTGSSETDLCTPKYSMCSDDNLMTLMAAGNAVGIMQSLLNLNSVNDITNSLFTVNSDDLASANVTNRCQVSCPSGHICCAAGTYVNPDTATHGTENQCLACPVGHYCPGDDWDTTTNYTTNKTACGANKYNDQESQTSVSACNDCPVENSTGSSAGSSECGCSAGYHWDSSTHTCAANVVPISWDGINDPGDAGTCTYGGSFTAPSAPETTPQGYMFIGWRIVSSVSNSNNNDNSNSNEQDNGEEIGKGE